MLGHALQSLGSMPLLGTRLTALHRDNKQHCSNKSQLPAASKQASPAHCWSATLRPLPACNFGGCPQRRRGRRGVTSILGNFEPKARFGDQNTAHSKDFIFPSPRAPLKRDTMFTRVLLALALVASNVSAFSLGSVRLAPVRQGTLALKACAASGNPASSTLGRRELLAGAAAAVPLALGASPALAARPKPSNGKWAKHEGPFDPAELEGAPLPCNRLPPPRGEPLPPARPNQRCMFARAPAPSPTCPTQASRRPRRVCSTRTSRSAPARCPSLGSSSPRTTRDTSSPTVRPTPHRSRPRRAARPAGRVTGPADARARAC